MASHNNWSSSTVGSAPQIGSSSRVSNTGVDRQARQTADHDNVMLAMYLHDPNVGSETFQAASLAHDIRHGNNAGRNSMGQQEWALFEKYKKEEGRQRADAAIRDFDTNFNKKGHGDHGLKGTRTKRSGSVGSDSSQPAAKKSSSKKK